MVSFDLSFSDYQFLKNTMNTFEKYVLNLIYRGDSVTFEIPEKDIDSFLLDYRSCFVRIGSDPGHEDLNKTGMRLNRIYLENIEPVIRTLP